MSASNKIQYIQGLRALCVLLVLFFHIDKSWLPSGYLGVDAFFAISGYVITRLIMSEWQQGHFRLKHFYFTRIRKLLPPLFVVVIATVGVFYFLHGQSDRFAVYLSSIFTVASLSNFYFYFDAGYFSEAAIYKPLLHTWSLGVEEQFYLLWPLLLLLLLKRTWITPRNVFVAALVLTVVSGAVVLVDFDLAFYLMPFRAYQLLFGAAFAVLALKLRARTRTDNNSNQQSTPSDKRRLAPYLGFVAIVSLIPVIVIALSWLEHSTPTRQFYAQLTVSFIIAGGCFVAERLTWFDSMAVNRSPIVLRLMQSAAAGYIGARSYLIYLVHWPIIVGIYSHYGKAYDESLPLKAVALIACLLCAEALHWLLSPTTASFRREGDRPATIATKTPHKRGRHSLKLIGAMGVVAAVVPLALLIAQISDTKQTRAYTLADFFPRLREQPAPDTKSQFRCHFGVEDHFPFDPELLKPCLSSSSKNVLVTGDSFSRDAYQALRFRHPDINFINIYLGGCPPYFGIDEADLKKQKVMKKCNRFREPVWRHVFDTVFQYGFDGNGFDALVVAGNWAARSLDSDVLRNSFSQLDNLSLDVFVMGVRPVYVDSIVRMHETEKITPDQEILNAHLHASPDVFNSQMTELVTGFDNLEYIDIYHSLCTPECNAYFENELVYSDHAHLTKAGARQVASNKDFASQLE